MTDQVITQLVPPAQTAETQAAVDSTQDTTQKESGLNTTSTDANASLTAENTTAENTAPLDAENAENQDQTASETADLATKKSGFEKRVEKLTTKVELAAREAEYWRKIALEQQSKAQEVQPQQPPIPTGLPNNRMPTLDDFGGDVQRYTDWSVEYKLALRDQQYQAQEQQRQIQSTLQTWTQKVEEVKKELPDYVEVMLDTEDWQPAPVINQAAFDSEYGPQILYYLAQHPDEYNRINKLTPGRILVEIGKIESKVSDEKENKQPTQSRKAPAPISTVKGTTAPVGGKSVYDMTAAEANAFYHKQEQEKRAARRGR